MTTPSETIKQAPAFYIFDTVDTDGKKEMKRVGAAFRHKKGNGFTLLVNNKRYAAFPPKPKAEADATSAQPTGGKGA
jgi:hypothetical protein